MHTLNLNVQVDHVVTLGRPRTLGNFSLDFEGEVWDDAQTLTGLEAPTKFWSSNFH